MDKADLFGAIATRRSCKRFSKHPVEMDKLLQVVQAGALAPSSGNIQNWKFIIITDIDQIRAMYDHALEQDAFLSATAAIIVCGDVEYAHTMYGMRGKRLYTIQNCAAAIQNMLLASHALSIGALWVRAFDEDKISTMYGIPSHVHRPQAIILFGYPLQEPEPKDEKPIDTLVFFNTWGNRVLRPHLVFYDWASEWRLQWQKFKGNLGGITERIKRDKKELSSEQKQGEMSSGDVAQSNWKQRMKDAIDQLKKDEYRTKK